MFKRWSFCHKQPYKIPVTNLHIILNICSGTCFTQFGATHRGTTAVPGDWVVGRKLLSSTIYSFVYMFF